VQCTARQPDVVTNFGVVKPNSSLENPPLTLKNPEGTLYVLPQ
jgi:hypothetical protein